MGNTWFWVPLAPKRFDQWTWNVTGVSAFNCSPAGSGAQRKVNLVHFSLKPDIWWRQFYYFFLRINEHTGQLLVRYIFVADSRRSPAPGASISVPRGHTTQPSPSPLPNVDPSNAETLPRCMRYCILAYNYNVLGSASNGLACFGFKTKLFRNLQSQLSA